MRPNTLACAIALLLISPTVWAQSPTEGSVFSGPRAAAPIVPAVPHDITLAEALAEADANSPALRAKRAQLVAAEALQADASALFNSNPEFSLERTRRVVPSNHSDSERLSEWNAGLSQAIEIAGQRGHRREAADTALAGLRAEIADARYLARAEISEQFYRVLALQQRVEVESQAVSLFDSTASAIQKRRAAGEDTRLDANVAAVEAERARNQLAIAQEQLLDARGELATTLQLPAGQLLHAVAELAPDISPDLAQPANRRQDAYQLADLLAAAAAQPRMRALTERESSARARLNLERASRYPDITVGVRTGREGPGSGRERLTTLTVSVPLPLFKRNRAGIGQAASDLGQVQIDRQAMQRDVPAHVTTLWSRLASVRERVRRLQETVLPALADNQALSLKSRQAGQIGLLELIVVNRQALDARRDLIDALTEFQVTRVALELAAGWPANQYSEGH